MKKLQQLIDDKRGIALVEFALSLPFLIMLFLGGFELSRYMIIHAKLENATYTIADIVAQQTSVTTSQLDQYMIAADEIMKPYIFENNGTVIVSAVHKDGDESPEVVWQYYYGEAGQNSNIGEESEEASLPNGLTLNEDDTVIVTETFYSFTPIFPSILLDNIEIYKTAIFKPRLGSLTTPPS